jgi:hypothetical protein
MRRFLLALSLAVSALAETRVPLPDDYVPSPCAQTAGLCRTFKPSELMQFGARAQASYIKSEWLMRHWDELTPAYAPYCAKLATCYAQPQNTNLFCDDVILSGTRPICARFPKDSDDHQQCLSFLRTYTTGIEINSHATWKATQECAAKLPKSETPRKLDWWIEPAQLPAGFNGKFTIYTLDAETRVPIQADIKIGDEIIYAKAAPSGLPMTFFEVPWKQKLIRNGREVVPPMVTVSTPGYETIAFRMPMAFPQVKVEMSPAELQSGKNEVTFTVRDSATNKPVDARIMAGDKILGDVDIRTGKLTATIEVRGKTRPEIWALSTWDAFSDVLVSPARR